MSRTGCRTVSLCRTVYSIMSSTSRDSALSSPDGEACAETRPDAPVEKPVPEPQLLTFGCRLNSYESELMRRLSREGRAEDEPDAQLVLVNTCAVTAEAERQARQAIRRARRENPEARIIVTGCAAQVNPERFAEMPEVDRVLGNVEKLQQESYASQGARVQVTDIMTLDETAGHLLDNRPAIEGFEGRSRAFLQVQNGCDHRCTFCIIPFGRGNSRSVPLGPILDQARILVENGYQEIVLTGVDLTAYGADLPGKPGLGGTVRRLLDGVPGLARLRLSSIDVAEIDPVLEELITDEPRIMPHLHLSLQSGDDMILKRMKRRHTCDQVRDFCARILAKRPEMLFGADLIAGFPTETEEMAANTLALVEECNIMHLHVFPFSARDSTPAARMPQLPGPVRQERAAALRALGERLLQAELHRQLAKTQQTGQLAAVLVEKVTDGIGTGRDESWRPAKVRGAITPGAVVMTRYDGLDGASLTGEAVAGIDQ